MLVYLHLLQNVHRSRKEEFVFILKALSISKVGTRIRWEVLEVLLSIQNNQMPCNLLPIHNSCVRSFSQVLITSSCLCFCRMDPDVCFLVWRGVLPCQESCSLVVVYFLHCARLAPFFLLLVASFLKELNLDWEGLVLLRDDGSVFIASSLRLLPSGFPSSAMHVGGCFLEDSHLLHCIVMVDFLLLIVSAMKHCESFWPIILPPANSLFSILWPTQADFLPCQVWLTMLAHRVCFPFADNNTYVPHPSTNLGPRCLTSVI